MTRLRIISKLDNEKLSLDYIIKIILVVCKKKKKVQRKKEKEKRMFRVDKVLKVDTK